MKIPLATRRTAALRCTGEMTDIRQVTAYTAPHTRASPTREDKYPRLAIYLNSRCTRLSSSDTCRLLAPPRNLPVLSSSLLHSIRRPPYLASCFSLFHSFTFFLLLSLLLTLLFCSVPPRLLSDRPRDGADPRQERAVCQALQARLLTTWIVKTSGRHPARWCTVNQAFAYRIFDLRPGDALAVTGRVVAPRRVGQSA